MRTTLALLGLLFFAACTKDGTDGENAPPDYARLEVSVSLCDPLVTPFCDPANDSLITVQGASVFLFEHEKFQQEGDPFVFDGSTDAQGKLTFSTLEQNEYWVTVKLPHPDGRHQKEYVKTPQRTTTYLSIIFEKE